MCRATHEGDLPLGGRIIPCAVLNNGTRILAASAVFKALERPRKGKSSETYRADRMPSFLNANNLQPFIDQEIMGWTELVQYVGINGKIESGYNAKLLRGICKVYLEARKAGVIHSSQQKTVEIAEKILYALADRGIESLVDEATGFSNLKEQFKQKVALFLEKSLQLEPAQWVKTFSDEFFEMIFIMKGWSWSGSVKRPGVVGHYINDLVYSRIAPNILQELRKLNPKAGSGRKRKHFQHLTPDFGNPILKDHLAGLLALGKASGYNWAVFNQMVNKAFPRYGQTMEIAFAFDYDKKLRSSNAKGKTKFDKTLEAVMHVPKPEKD